MADYFERLLLLKQSVLFSAVSIDDLRHVARSLEMRTYFTGDRIFRRNDTGDHLYLIVSGRVGITFEDDAGGADRYVAILVAGDCLGEMNLLDDLPRSATAQVIEDCDVLMLEKTRLRSLILSYPEISIGMMKSLSLRVREANRRASEKR